MNIEKTQKKEYVAPEMEEVELFCRGNLLQEASLGGEDCDPTDGCFS